MTFVPELFVGYVIGVTFVGLFLLVAFICDILERRL